MGILIFVIVCLVIGVLLYMLNPKAFKSDFKDETFTTTLSQKELQAKFKENYLWACEVFGVRESVYDTLAAEVKRYPRLGVVYFTYYYVSKYSTHYPKIERCLNHISDWEDTKQQEVFANEFISIAERLRSNFDLDEYELLNKYNLFDKSTLTKKFEVDNMQLFQLSNET